MLITDLLKVATKKVANLKSKVEENVLTWAAASSPRIT